MKKIIDEELLGNTDNIKNYKAKMHILIKTIKGKSPQEIFIYKQKLLYKKEDIKIFDIIEDENENILTIIYDIDSKEKIEELINNELEIKEAIIKNSCSAISKKEIDELFGKQDCMCKINAVNSNKNNLIGTGFFLDLNNNNISFKKKCLVTNNHVLNSENIRIGEEIKLEYKGNKKIIKITEKRNVFTDEKLDYTCIEIFKEDNIKQFFKIDKNILENDLNYLKDKDIFILQFPKGKDLSFSNGKILSIKDNNILHNSSTDEGSSGSPIILRNSDLSIVALHRGSNNISFNISISINSIIDDVEKKYKLKLSSSKKEEIKENSQSWSDFSFSKIIAFIGVILTVFFLGRKSK